MLFINKAKQSTDKSGKKRAAEAALFADFFHH